MLPTPDTFTHSQWVENSYNFELKNCEHTDYFYDPNNHTSNDAFKEAATKFIAKVTALSRDNARLLTFIDSQRTSGAIVKYGSTYKVDVERIIYEPN